MAHYAYLDENNIVTKVVVGKGEDTKPDGYSSWEEYLSAKRNNNLPVKRTSYNTHSGIHWQVENPLIPSDDQSKAFRGNYAGVGFSYIEEIDAFMQPKPYDSWILNESSYTWEPPVEIPDSENAYTWNEESQTWELAEEAS